MQGDIAISNMPDGSKMVVCNLDPPALETLRNGGGISMKTIKGIEGISFFFISRSTTEDFQKFVMTVFSN